MRKKLEIGEDTSIRFARLHEGKFVELEDGTSQNTLLLTSRVTLHR